MQYSKNNPTGEHAAYLRDFWASVGGETRRNVSPLDREAVIRELKFAGNKFIYYCRKAPTLEQQEAMRKKSRTVFDNVKNKRNRYKLKPQQQCLACSEAAQVRHHIIWLKNGGRNCKRNICFLCHRCHADVHPWLKPYLNAQKFTMDKSVQKAIATELSWVQQEEW